MSPNFYNTLFQNIKGRIIQLEGKSIPVEDLVDDENDDTGKKKFLLGFLG